MNERLTIQDLTDLLAAKHSMTKKDAEAFVKEFFLLIEQALENENTVKIKGLGTFKLIDVDSRESVNVNTGERFQKIGAEFATDGAGELAPDVVRVHIDDTIRDKLQREGFIHIVRIHICGHLLNEVAALGAGAVPAQTNQTAGNELLQRAALTHGVHDDIHAPLGLTAAHASGDHGDECFLKQAGILGGLCQFMHLFFNLRAVL